jgi:hypothetical protein
MVLLISVPPKQPYNDLLFTDQEAKVQKRCDRNRKRSQRRAIHCPIHNCYIDSVSQKYGLFAEQPGQLQARGIPRREAMLLVAAKTTVSLQGIICVNRDLNMIYLLPLLNFGNKQQE